MCSLCRGFRRRISRFDDWDDLRDVWLSISDEVATDEFKECPRFRFRILGITLLCNILSVEDRRDESAGIRVGVGEIVGVDEASDDTLFFGVDWSGRLR